MRVDAHFSQLAGDRIWAQMCPFREPRRRRSGVRRVSSRACRSFWGMSRVGLKFLTRTHLINGASGLGSNQDAACPRNCRNIARTEPQVSESSEAKRIICNSQDLTLHTWLTARVVVVRCPPSTLNFLSPRYCDGMVATANLTIGVVSSTCLAFERSTNPAQLYVGRGPGATSR